MLHCRHVIVHRKINFTLLATTVYSGGPGFLKYAFIFDTPGKC